MLLLNAPTYKHYFKDILTNKRDLPLISTYYIKMTEELCSAAITNEQWSQDFRVGIPVSKPEQNAQWFNVHPIICVLSS